MAALTAIGFMLASYTATPPRPCRATMRSKVVASALTESPRRAGSAASRKRSATISARCCSSTCSANRSARTSLHAATTTTSVTPLTSSAINLKLRVMYKQRGGRYRPAPLASTRRPDALGEHPDHDAPVLRATFFGFVGRHRLLAPVANHVHLVQRNLMLLEEVTLHDLGALHADLLVDFLAADVVRVAFDLDEGAVRIALELGDHLVDLGLGFIRQIGLAELELAFVLADDHRVDEPLRRFVERVGSRADFGRPGAGGPGVVAGCVGGLLCGIGCALRRLRLRVHGVDRAFVLPRPFLGFLDGLRQVVNLAVDLPHAVSDELLGGARRQTYRDHAGERQCRHPFRHTVPPQQLVMTGRWLLVPRRTRCVFAPRTSRHARGPSADASPRACSTRTTIRTDTGAPTRSDAPRRRTPLVCCPGTG